MKSKGITEAQFLALLQKVLPQTVADAHLATRVYDEVAKEIRLINSIKSFEKFCQTGSVPNVEPETVKELHVDLASKFGEENITVAPTEKGDAMAVEITLPDRTLASHVKVAPEGSEGDDEAKVPFVPFPVSLPEDPELVWVLARREDLAPEEAARSLAKIEEEFWATKGGQKLLRDRIERNFAEFVANVPAAMLGDSGLKRHYKEPETVQTLRLLKETLQTTAGIEEAVPV